MPFDRNDFNASSCSQADDDDTTSAMMVTEYPLRFKSVTLIKLKPVIDAIKLTKRGLRNADLSLDADQNDLIGAFLGDEGHDFRCDHRKERLVK